MKHPSDSDEFAQTKYYIKSEGYCIFHSFNTHNLEIQKVKKVLLLIGISSIVIASILM